MKPITIPTINNNDTQATLVEWRKADGSVVQPQETLAVLETSKATFDLPCEAAGLLHLQATPGEAYDFGATIGYIFADATERDKFLAGQAGKSSAAVTGDLVVTQSAQQLVAAHGITEQQLRSLGKKIIKTQDLAALIATPAAAAPAEALRPSQHQTAIARLVSRSHASVPKSFILKKIICDAALDRLTEYGKREGLMVGLADVLVQVVSTLPGAFPFFFGELRDDLQFVPAKSAHIGVTFDLGTGLFIPVIRSAAELSLKETAQRMMGLRMKALRNKFTSDDLTGGNISISINTDADIVLVSPIIQVPQTCMISVAAVQSELHLSAEGQVRTRRFFNLGLAFDHRVINGYQANAFLNAIKTGLDSPAWDAAR